MKHFSLIQGSSSYRLSAIFMDISNGLLLKVHIATYKIRQRACSSYGDFIDRGRLLTKELIEQGYMLEKLKIYFRRFYGRYNNLVKHYNTPLSQLLCDLVLC